MSSRMSLEWAYVGSVEMVAGGSRGVRCSCTGKTHQAVFV
jgi:hypothetical protein